MSEEKQISVGGVLIVIIDSDLLQMKLSAYEDTGSLLKVCYAEPAHVLTQCRISEMTMAKKQAKSTNRVTKLHRHNRSGAQEKPSISDLTRRPITKLIVVFVHN